jgi:hypothetical protein
MDTFLENLPYLMNTEIPISDTVLDPIRRKSIEGLLPEKEYTIDTHEIGEHKVTGAVLEAAIADTTSIANIRAALPEAFRAAVNAGNKATIHHNLLAAARDIARYENIEYDASGPKSILEMAYEVAETAMGKYNYKMSGDDFTFVMAMMTVSFHTLHDVTEGDFFKLSTDGSGIPGAIRKILGRDAYDRLKELKIKAETADFTDPELKARFDQCILLSELDILCAEDVTEVESVLREASDEAQLATATARIIEIVADLNDAEGAILKLDWSPAVKTIATKIINDTREAISLAITADSEARA